MAKPQRTKPVFRQGCDEVGRFCLDALGHLIEVDTKPLCESLNGRKRRPRTVVLPGGDSLPGAIDEHCNVSLGEPLRQTEGRQSWNRTECSQRAAVSLLSPCSLTITLLVRCDQQFADIHGVELGRLCVRLCQGAPTCRPPMR